jgi:hypothetical protein
MLPMSSDRVLQILRGSKRMATRTRIRFTSVINVDASLYAFERVER